MDSLSSDGRSVFSSALAMTILASVSVALRFLARYWTTASFAADDWWILSAMIFMYAWMGVQFWGIFAGGGGGNIAVIAQNLPVFTNYLKSLYTLLPLYMWAITSVKLSLIFLYRRLFVTNRFLWASFITGIACVLWWFVVTICTLLECLPPQKLWEPELDGTCYNYPLFFLGSEIADTVLDVVVLGLPVPAVLSLKMSAKQKFSLCSLFLLGGFVTITGIVRIAIVYLPGENDLAFIPAEVWGSIHLGTAIICACIPTYRPLFLKLGIIPKAFITRGTEHAPSSSTRDYNMKVFAGNKSSHYAEISSLGKDDLEASQIGIARTSQSP